MENTGCKPCFTLRQNEKRMNVCNLDCSSITTVHYTTHGMDWWEWVRFIYNVRTNPSRYNRVCNTGFTFSFTGIECVQEINCAAGE